MPPGLPSLPRSTEAHLREHRTERGAALAALQRLWRRVGDDLDESWLTLGPQMLQVLDEAQERVTAAALDYIPQVIEETGQRARDAAYTVRPDAFVGAAGDGRPTEGLLFGSITRAKEALAGGSTKTEALRRGGEFLSLASGTVLSDTARTAERMASHAHRTQGWIRVLTPPSCGRCIALTGYSGYSKPFRRHPGCDCGFMPISYALAEDFPVSPKDYLDSLDDKALARALGSKANAEAYRLGADPIQIVNAYRNGIKSAQTWSGKITYTYEGTTRRGYAYRAMKAAGLGGERDVKLGGRYSRTANVRLMPETILNRAPNRAQAVEMLRAYGWI